MPPKQSKAKYFQKSGDTDTEEPEPVQDPITLDITEHDSVPAKKPRKKRVDISPKPIIVPEGTVTISRAEAKRIKVAEKGPYIMSEKQKANVERLKILTQERKAKRDADTEENKQKLADQLATKKREEDLILAKTKRVKVNVRPPKPKKVKIVAPVAPEPVESEEDYDEETETEYVETFKRQRKPSAPKKRKAPVVESESGNDTEEIISKVRSLKNTITQSQHNSILSKFF